MLQQTPESKRLPLHHIHGRRLSTKDFHFSAPETASPASTTFTKTEPNATTLVPPPAHGGMYFNEPQQRHCGTHVEVATTLWPPDTTNYWFPNWKELFHGFLVVEKGQAFVADSELSGGGGIVCTPQQRPGSPPQHCSTQPRHLSSDNANSSLHNHPSSHQQPRPTCGQYPLPIPSSSHSPSMRQERDQAQIGNANKAFSSPSKAPATITKCSVKSPPWLPQGWITEIHIRRTGNTAGMRDKYFKHLASGRRFRSRKDVLHFTSTGKSRIRKQSMDNRGLLFSTGHSLVKTFAHRKRSILGGLKPFSESYSEKKHSTHVVNSLLQGLSQPRSNNDLGLPYKQSNSLCSSSKESAKERAHKLPVKKKAKTSPLRIEEDKQASKLWQWLTKPVVARDNGTSLHQEMLTLSFSSLGVEKKTANMADQKSVKDLSLRHQTAHRANQLSKEIRAAHDDVVQMSREMQATAEKLSREINVSKKDIGSASEMQGSGSKQLCVVLGDDSEPGKRCRSNIETLSSATSSSVHKASSNATNDLPKTAHSSTAASSSMICGVPMPADNTSSIPRERQFFIQGATYTPQDSSFSLPMSQPTAWPDMMVHSKVQMATTVDNPAKIGTQKAAGGHGDAVGHATQPVQTILEGSIQKHVFPAVKMPQKTAEWVAANGDVIQIALRPEMPTVHAQNSLQVSIATETSASASCDMTQPTHEITDAARSGVLRTNDCSKKPDEAGEANHAQAARGPSPVLTEGQAIPSLGLCSNPMVQDVAGEVKPGILSYEIHLSGPCSGLLNGMQETDCGRNVKWQPMDEVIARRLRRKKFSAVLNPKLDLSKLSPSLTTRQRAKVVERMKARHARELLATLGKHICHKAVWRKP